MSNEYMECAKIYFSNNFRDTYIKGNPDITFFKIHYKQYKNEEDELVSFPTKKYKDEKVKR